MFEYIVGAILWFSFLTMRTAYTTWDLSGHDTLGALIHAVIWPVSLGGMIVYAILNRGEYLLEDDDET